VTATYDSWYTILVFSAKRFEVSNAALDKRSEEKSSNSPDLLKPFAAHGLGGMHSQALEFQWS
jgi:hypothetical protein